MSLPAIIESVSEMRSRIVAAQRNGERVGLIPTMGALHAGHLSLVEKSAAECQRTIVTIFVNPTQFGPQEDFQKYPRTLDADLALLAPLGVEAVFVPQHHDMYPPGFSTYIEPPSVALPLEGAFRPGHFRGVATVVLKLFEICPADVAYFGAKDYQQTLVVRKMVEDLNLPIRISIEPTLREPDGLAMSSRNRYLSPAEREQALTLSLSLQRAADLLAAGERVAAKILASMQELFAAAGITSIDYIALADPETLLPVEQIHGPVVALIAARVGTTRLIDNRVLTPPNV
ncbi:MAG TPA: pantoate--beta-alanine ligase [Pirellulaceae bacterium]|nr:pantoate--beta-alanine ligase [Pirellulaceae bacterium]